MTVLLMALPSAQTEKYPFLEYFRFVPSVLTLHPESKAPGLCRAAELRPGVALRVGPAQDRSKRRAGGRSRATHRLLSWAGASRKERVRCAAGVRNQGKRAAQGVARAGPADSKSTNSDERRPSASRARRCPTRRMPPADPAEIRLGPRGRGRRRGQPAHLKSASLKEGEPPASQARHLSMHGPKKKP